MARSRACPTVVGGRARRSPHRPLLRVPRWAALAATAALVATVAALAGTPAAAATPALSPATPVATTMAPPTGPGLTPWSIGSTGEDEARDGYYTLYGPDGRELLVMGLRVHAGDQFLSEDNVWYEVSRVAGFAAELRLIPKGRWPLQDRAADTSPVMAPASAVSAGPRIRTYHSHSDESYTPSDGKSNIPEHGGIYQVGAALRDALAKIGYDAAQDTTAHDPHDEGAYARSRRTANRLIQEGATVLFDVHRDTAPAEAYRRIIGSQPVTQAMIVVGRDNPTMQANLGFAKAVKDAADRVHPHLIRGIFLGEGGYNQDLTPRALLFEVGSYTNRREEAEAGVRLLADAMPGVLGPPQPPQPSGAVPPPATHPAERSGHSRALAWLAGLAAVGGAVFLVVAAGGLDPAAERLRLLGREFADLLPRRRNRL